MNRFDLDIISNVKTIWDFLVLDEKVEPCDIIMGCGCINTDIPVYCAQLFKEGYGKKILFAGGLGKLTKHQFNKSEAEVYRDIALGEGVSSSDILLETTSTNTGDNFLLSKSILDENGCQKILIVHKPYSERRTLLTAMAQLPDYEWLITSPCSQFDVYLSYMQMDEELFQNQVSLMVGDVQRCMIYPQLGYMLESEIPSQVMESYSYLIEKGFDNYIFSENKILSMTKSKNK